MRVRPTVSVVLVAILAASLVAVVSGPAAGARVAAKPSACKVLKAAEVTRVTGFAAAKSARQQPGPPSASICNYTLADSTIRTVSVFVQPGNGQVAKIGYKTAKATFKDQLEPVTGFGKNAFYAAGGLNVLYVLQGDTLLYVQYVALGADDPAKIKSDVEAMTKIARTRI